MKHALLEQFSRWIRVTRLNQTKILQKLKWSFTVMKNGSSELTEEIDWGRTGLLGDHRRKEFFQGIDLAKNEDNSLKLLLNFL